MPYFSIGVSSKPPGENPWEESREMRIELVFLDCMKLDWGFPLKHQVTLKKGELAYYSFKSKAGVFTRCAYTDSHAKFKLEIDIWDKSREKFLRTIKGNLDIKKVWADNGWWPTIGQGSDDYELEARGTGHFKFEPSSEGLSVFRPVMNIIAKLTPPAGSQSVLLRPYKS